MKKNISHKIIAILLSVFMTFFIFPANVFATSSDTSSGTITAPDWMIGYNDYAKPDTLSQYRDYFGHLAPTPSFEISDNMFTDMAKVYFDYRNEDRPGFYEETFEEYLAQEQKFYNEYYLGEEKFSYIITSYYYNDGHYDSRVYVFFSSKPLIFSSDNRLHYSPGSSLITFDYYTCFSSYFKGEVFISPLSYFSNLSGGGSLVQIPPSTCSYPSVIVHPGSSPIYNESGQELGGLDIAPDVGGGGDISSDGFKLQTQLGIYSKYEISDYPKSPPLTKFDGFYNTPDQAFLDDNVKKTGPKLDYGKFYFNPSQVTDGNSKRAIALALFNKRYYSYHLYYFVQSQFNTGGEWRKKSVWSSSPLVFEPATIKDGEYFTPKMKVRDSSIAVVVDYGADKTEMSVLFSGSILFRPSVTSDTLQHFVKYYINDDEQVKKDTSSRNNGTLTVVPDGNGNDTVINGSGDDVTDDEDNGWGIGSVLPPKPPKPDENSGVLDWFKWLYDSVGLFFTTVTKGISSIFTQCSSFFSFLGETFSFFPSEVWTLITVGIGLIIVLRFLGR